MSFLTSVFFADNLVDMFLSHLFFFDQGHNPTVVGTEIVLRRVAIELTTRTRAVDVGGASGCPQRKHNAILINGRHLGWLTFLHISLRLIKRCCVLCLAHGHLHHTGGRFETTRRDFRHIFWAYDKKRNFSCRYWFRILINTLSSYFVMRFRNIS